MTSRECQLRSDCGSWSGLSGQHGPRRRSVRWFRKSALLYARPSERKTTHTVAEMWLSYSICTCWATRHTLGRYVWTWQHSRCFASLCGPLYDAVPCVSAGVPEADCVPEVHWQKNRLLGSHAAAGREAGRPPTNDKLHQEVSGGHTEPFFLRSTIYKHTFCYWLKKLNAMFTFVFYSSSFFFSHIPVTWITVHNMCRAWPCAL